MVSFIEPESRSVIAKGWEERKQAVVIKLNSSFKSQSDSREFALHSAEPGLILTPHMVPPSL